MICASKRKLRHTHPLLRHYLHHQLLQPSAEGSSDAVVHCFDL